MAWLRNLNLGKHPPISSLWDAIFCNLKFFEILSNQGKGAGGEIQLTDAMKTMIENQPFYACSYEGRSFDCGSKVGFLAANVAFALSRDDIGEDFREALKKLIEAN